MVTVVFSTNASLRSSILRKRVGKRRGWWLEATTVVLDKAACANPGKVIICRQSLLIKLSDAAPYRQLHHPGLASPAGD